MSFELQRERLVENELRILGIRDEAVLKAMRDVPREAFVSEEMREFAYRNAPLPIGSGQTISQPLIVAHMAVKRTRPDDRVLEIGRRFGACGGGPRGSQRKCSRWSGIEVGRYRHRETQAIGLDNVRKSCAGTARGLAERGAV
jgi:hypothetical protein